MVVDNILKLVQDDFEGVLDELEDIARIWYKIDEPDYKAAFMLQLQCMVLGLTAWHDAWHEVTGVSPEEADVSESGQERLTS